MFTLLSILFGKLWWHFSKEGELDYEELPLLGKIGFRVYVFYLKILAKICGLTLEELIKKTFLNESES